MMDAVVTGALVTKPLLTASAQALEEHITGISHAVSIGGRVVKDHTGAGPGRLRHGSPGGSGDRLRRAAARGTAAAGAAAARILTLCESTGVGEGAAARSLESGRGGQGGGERQHRHQTTTDQYVTEQHKLVIT